MQDIPVCICWTLPDPSSLLHLLGLPWLGPQGLEPPVREVDPVRRRVRGQHLPAGRRECASAAARQAATGLVMVGAGLAGMCSAQRASGRTSAISPGRSRRVTMSSL